MNAARLVAFFFCFSAFAEVDYKQVKNHYDNVAFGASTITGTQVDPFALIPLNNDLFWTYVNPDEGTSAHAFFRLLHAMAVRIPVHERESIKIVQFHLEKGKGMLGMLEELGIMGPNPHLYEEIVEFAMTVDSWHPTPTFSFFITFKKPETRINVSTKEKKVNYTATYNGKQYCLEHICFTSDKTVTFKLKRGKEDNAEFVHVSDISSMRLVRSFTVFGETRFTKEQRAQMEHIITDIRIFDRSNDMRVRFGPEKSQVHTIRF